MIKYYYTRQNKLSTWSCCAPLELAAGWLEANNVAGRPAGRPSERPSERPASLLAAPLVVALAPPGQTRLESFKGFWLKFLTN